MAVRFYPLVRFQSASDSFRFAVPTRSASVVFADNLCVHTVRTNGWERMAVRFYPLVRFHSPSVSFRFAVPTQSASVEPLRAPGAGQRMGADGRPFLSACPIPIR